MTDNTPKLGDQVLIIDDPGLAPYCGQTGTVEQLDVECYGGPGVTVATLDYGLVRAPYWAIRRVH